MIVKLNGIVEEIFKEFIILNVNGVGYKVEGFFNNLLEEQKVSLYIHTHVREQEFRLFGFDSKDKYLIFENLLQVSGVGPKTALNVINNIGIDTVVSAIEDEKADLLISPGVGKKTAQRIVIDLKTKIEKLNIKLDKLKINSKILMKNNLKEVAEALIELGFNKSEIEKTIIDIEDKDNLKSDQILKKALKYLNKSINVSKN